ncbi:MAG: polysaccharide pyruvyl transferase family protein [Clostridium sp.]|nr:polysaccharide pyruvyl transferase family protein [Clostridium sp.]
MTKSIGILYDSISGNTGDAAIGLSLRKIMKDLNTDFDELVPGNYNPNLYDCIVIGGGHIIRENNDFFYDKFKIRGRHILNAVGVVGNPKNMEYLNDYRYVTFRSKGDRDKINYLKKDSKVVPCTTMLLSDIPNLKIENDQTSIGIHMLPGVMSNEEEEKFINWLNKLPYHIYFMPITHYNNDYIYMQKLCLKLKNASVMPIMTPIEIFTIIGKFKFMITCSLHGSIFSYIHNVPFILMDQEKSRFFLEDRGLEKYLFSSLDQIIDLSNDIINKPLDYSKLILKDKEILKEHVRRIQDNLPKNIYATSKSNKSDYILQTNYQIQFMQLKISELTSKCNELENERSNLNRNLSKANADLRNLNVQNEKTNCENYKLKLDISNIHNSKAWRLVTKFRKVEIPILKFLKIKK